MTARAILVCGRIASGKSAYARTLLARGRAALLSVDEVMLAAFGQQAGERHDLYAERIKRYLLAKSLELLHAGVDVVLDWGPWTREGRDAVRAFYAQRGIPFELHGLRVSEETRKARMLARNRAVLQGSEDAYFVDEGLAGKFLAQYEELGEDEVDVWVRE